MKTLPLSGQDLFAFGELEGFTPHISRLVYMLEIVRANTLYFVRDLTAEQLDAQVLEGGNSIGMLLAHFAGTERGYQMLTFEGREDGFEQPENVLGEAGRRAFQGQPLEFYVQRMADVRADTLAGLRQRDDAWLEAPFRAFEWPQDINAHWCWFHVFEDELRHQGQIIILRKELERRAESGAV